MRNLATRTAAMATGPKHHDADGFTVKETRTLNETRRPGSDETRKRIEGCGVVYPGNSLGYAGNSMDPCVHTSGRPHIPQNVPMRVAME